MKLGPALIRTQEEAAELIQAIAKFMRFGARPTAAGITYDNVADIQKEMTDLYRRMREAAGLLNISWREISEQGCMPKPSPDDDLARYEAEDWR